MPEITKLTVANEQGERVTYDIRDVNALNKMSNYIVDNTMSQEDIIEIFAKEEPKVITFTKGDYEFTQNIFLSSNTYVELNDSTLYSSNGKLILSYRPDDTYTEYDGVHNVEIRNGKLEMHFALMHSSDIRFIDLEFLRTIRTHSMQFGGCRNILISGCTFNGMRKDDSKVSVQENIQLEPCTYVGQPWAAEDSPMYNHLGNYNIVIENCIFNAGDGINNRLYTGIGTHAGDDTNTFFNKNVTISGCAFGNAWYSAISTFGADGWVIKNNTFVMSELPNDNIQIRWRGMTKNVVVEGNNFESCSVAISNVNVDQCENMQYINNRIVSDLGSGNAIILQATKGGVISGNTIKATNTAINISPSGFESRDIIIEGNDIEHVSSSHNYSVSIHNNTYNVKVIGNKCKQITDVAFLNYRPSDIEDEPQLFYANNHIDRAGSNPVNDIVLNEGMNVSNVFGSYFPLHSAGSAYAAITDGTPNKFGLKNFDRLLVRVCTAGSGSYMRDFVVTDWVIGEKISSSTSNRYYDFLMTDSSRANIIKGRLTVKPNGTFSWFSDNSAMTLFGLYGFNDINR